MNAVHSARGRVGIKRLPMSLARRQVANSVNKVYSPGKGATDLGPPTSRKQTRETGGSAVGDTCSGGEGFDQHAIGIAGQVPHGKPEQVVLDDETSLFSERLWVVVGIHRLIGLVVKEGLRV